MAQYHQTLIQQVLSLGASHAALLPVSQLPFDPSFRDLCRSNACGMYGACWMCPPYIGSSEELIEQAKAFEPSLRWRTASISRGCWRLANSRTSWPETFAFCCWRTAVLPFCSWGQGAAANAPFAQRKRTLPADFRTKLCHHWRRTALTYPALPSVAECTISME